MNFFFKFRWSAAFAVALCLAGSKVEAQVSGYFGLSVVSSADSILVSNSLTYTITVTNLINADLTTVNTYVTNTLSPSVQFESAIPSFGGLVTNYNNLVIFNLGEMGFGGVAQMSLTVQPTAAGLITNQVVVAVGSIFVTNSATTNVVTLVTNLPPVEADLGVAITVPTTAVITNDWMIYSVKVFNSGPDAAPGVMFTNTLPPGVVLKGVLPAQPGYTVSSSNLIFNLGTLNGGVSTNFQFTVKPTNVGGLNFSASVGATGVFDPNLANNSASASMVVTNYLSGIFSAVTNSAQIVNLQNGLIEQSILLSNTGTNSAPAVRVVMTGLTNRLFNAAGTNNGNPFVVYAKQLAPGQSVNLLLQYAPRTSFPFVNGQLQAFAVPAPDLTPPAVSSASASLNITHIVELPNGNMIIEFPSTAGKTYTIVYSDNGSFSNAMIAPPNIVAPANQVQWIDYGPPTTTSTPTSAKARFYRVIQNP